MDLIKQQLQRIGEQLGGLSASQKMLTASLVAIMVMTMMWWARFAGNSEMTPLLDQPITGDDAAQIAQAVRSAGIEVKIVGDRVMVPTELQPTALAAAGWARALPANSKSGFDEMIKQIGPFETEAKTGAMLNRAREMTLARMIQSWPGVQKADVMINAESRRRIGGGGDIEPSAIVTIATRGSADVKPKQLADASSAAVAAATSGLKPGRVSVVVDGSKQRTHDDGQDFSGELFDQIAKTEIYLTNQLQEMLMPNARVMVKASINTVSSHEVKEIYDAKNTLVKEESIEQSTSETTTPSPGASEPGAQANVGISGESLPPPSDATTSTEKSITKLSILPSKSLETLTKPAGTPAAVSAVVRIPMSYFINRHKLANPTADAPDEKTLQPRIDAELAEIKKMVQTATNLKADDAVSVNTYWDELPLLAAQGATDVQSGGGMGLIVTSHVKEVVIGALAALSLFMVSMMVKKGGTPAPAIAAPIELHEVPTLGSEENVAGEVGESNSMLDGMELDEDAIKAQQMVEQVSTLVKENPDGAANLVKRWLNK